MVLVPAGAPTRGQTPPYIVYRACVCDVTSAAPQGTDMCDGRGRYSTGATGFRQEKPRQGGVRTHAPRADREASRGRQVAVWESPSQSTHVRGARVDGCDETLKGGSRAEKDPQKRVSVLVPVLPSLSPTNDPPLVFLAPERWAGCAGVRPTTGLPRGCANDANSLRRPRVGMKTVGNGIYSIISFFFNCE